MHVIPPLPTGFYLLSLGLGWGIASLPAGAVVPTTVSPSRPILQIAESRLEEQLKDFPYWSNLCALQADSGKYDEAIKSCEAAILLRQEDPVIWAEYGGVRLQQKNYPEAIAALDRSLKFNPKTSLALTYKCMAFSALGRQEEALDTCNEALRVDGNWGRRSPALAWFQRGKILGLQTQYDQALFAYDQALLQAPQNSQYLVYRCDVLNALKQYETAITSCDQALAGNGQWGDQSPAVAWFYRGQAQRQLKRWQGAIADYDRSLNLDPARADTWTAQAMVLEQLTRYPEALTSYNQATQLNPKSSLAQVGRCLVLNLLNQYEEAQKSCDLAMQGDGTWREPGIAQAWNQKAQALTGLGKLDEALAAANRAVGMRPDWADAWSDRAVVLWYMKQYDVALESVQRALDVNPKDTRAWANQGRIWRSLNQPEKARTAYAEALKWNPLDAGIWANQSAVQWTLGAFEEALYSANRAIAINPNLVQAWQNRAVTLVALKAYAQAQTSYERAVELDQTNAESWTGLGLVLAQLGQYPKAMEVLQKAVSLNPNQVLAQKALQALMQRQQAAPVKSLK